MFTSYITSVYSCTHKPGMMIISSSGIIKFWYETMHYHKAMLAPSGLSCLMPSSTALTLYQPMMHIICIMSSHKSIRIYMRCIILGVNTLYRLFCFVNMFPMVGKGLIAYYHATPCLKTFWDSDPYIFGKYCLLLSSFLLLYIPIQYAEVSTLRTHRHNPVVLIECWCHPYVESVATNIAINMVRACVENLYHSHSSLLMWMHTSLQRQALRPRI